MPRKQNSAKKQIWKDLVAGQEDFMKSLVQEVIQQVLEQEMEELPQDGKGNGPRSGWGIGRAIIGGGW